MKNALGLPLLFIIKMSIFLSIVYPFINVIKCYGCLCHLFMVRFWCVVCMLRCVPYFLLKRGGCVCRVIQSSYNANNNNSSYKSGAIIILQVTCFINKNSNNLVTIVGTKGNFS